MLHSLLDTKIRTEAARHGIEKYHVKEDQYVFTRIIPENKLILELNTADLVIFHSPSFLIVNPGAFATTDEISVNGIESRVHKNVGGDFEVYQDPGTGWVFATVRPPFIFAAKGKTEMLASYGAGVIGASGYVLGVTIIPI